MKTLVIAEKPSVAQDIVRALTPSSGKFERANDFFENDKYVVTSAVGHLLEIQAPEEFEVKRGKWSFANLPVIPPHFDVRPVEKTKSRLNAVVKLAKRRDVSFLINACDAGREGELIFRLIEQYAFAGKSGKPSKRLWLQSMTPEAIREGFDNLRDDAQMQGLHDAARSRSEADWLVGINGTRAMTAFNSRDGGFFLTTVGRVQTPTLAVVVEREEQIKKHISRPYWEVIADFKAASGEYQGKYQDLSFKKDTNDVDKRADRIWDKTTAEEIAKAVNGQTCEVTDESKPTSQISPALFDLTSLQREANAKFGFSAKTTLQIAQSLYEKHKALTYPRTDSRHLPEDYLQVARKTCEMLAASQMQHIAPHAQKALKENYIKPNKRIFDNKKVSDHFAIIPTLQEPASLSEIEQKLYDLVVKRFLAVFYPAAQHLVTTRTTTYKGEKEYHFISSGRVLVSAGWLAIYGKEEAQTKDGVQETNLVAIEKGEKVKNQKTEIKEQHTRPPARYTEATLLGAMEGAGKTIDDDELRQHMQEKGLGTPATRAAIIEGLITEKYLHREGREMIATAKAFQLMTLLRGLQVEELCRPDLTGQWEYKLAQIEKGELSRAAFMQEIAQMTNRIVIKAKEYDRDTIPGDYATLAAQCPQCGGIVKENYRRFACTGSAQEEKPACGFSFTKTPAGRTFSTSEANELLQNKKIGPLEGFRSKAGWAFTAELALIENKEDGQYKLEFDFGQENEKNQEEIQADLSGAPILGNCPKCKANVKELGTNYICEHSVSSPARAAATCDFKLAKTILQQEINNEQISKLLKEGKTDVLTKFISKRTNRAFKARLIWSEQDGRPIFEFEGKDGKPIASKPPAKKATGTKTTAKTAAKTTAKKTATKKEPKAGNLTPSPELAAIIGEGTYGRGEATKLLWDYIKANNLQDEKDKRQIIADEKLKAIFDGQASLGMFKLAGILTKHLIK